MDIDKDDGDSNISFKPVSIGAGYTYILKSLKDNKLYIGSTTDLQKRIPEHQSGKVFATKHRLPIKLCYYEAYTEGWMARKREKQLKYFGKAYQTLKKRLML